MPLSSGCRATLVGLVLRSGLDDKLTTFRRGRVLGEADTLACFALRLGFRELEDPLLAPRRFVVLATFCGVGETLLPNFFDRRRDFGDGALELLAARFRLDRFGCSESLLSTRFFPVFFK